MSRLSDLSELEKLEELVINHDALSSNLVLLSFDELLRCGEVLDYFPPSLAILDLVGFSWDEPQMVYTQYVKNTTIQGWSNQLPRFYALIAALPMKEIFLNVTFIHERHDDGCGATYPAANDPLLMFLKSTAEQLDSLGTKFTVWYKIHNSTVESQLLVGPSYFAPECYEECCENFADRYRVEPTRFPDHYNLDEMEEAPSPSSA